VEKKNHPVSRSGLNNFGFGIADFGFVEEMIKFELLDSRPGS
jgi:hypothetical protein